MYIAHLTFEDWLHAVEVEGLDRVCVQYLTTGGSTAGGAVVTITSAVVLTAAKETVGVVSFARIVVEKAEMWQREKEQRAAIVDRAREAGQIAESAILMQISWACVRRGMLLQPGMLDDLPKITTDHELWRWEKTATEDPVDRVLRRRIVAAM